MRCPKCGAFLEEGKDTCMMCGVNVKTYIPETNPNATFSANNSASFGSGNDFRTGASNVGFNNQQPKSYNDNRFNKDTHYAPLSNADRDIFDRVHENKGLVNMIIVFVIFAIIAASGFFYYKSKTKEVPLVPIIENLYFTVDESFSQLNGANRNSISYAKSGSKGNDCSITINVGASTSGDHVEDFFDEVKANLEPEKDASNNIINELDIYTPAEGDNIINGNTWYYLNIFYKSSPASSPTELRYKYMTSMDKGLYYDITLTNYSNDAICSASLDNFAKSLKFLN